MALLVDSNVIVDLVEDDPRWADWSVRVLDQYAAGHQLLINAVIYAEISIGFRRIEELEEALAAGGFEMAPVPREALFLAGKAFVTYRKRAGSRASSLPDFFIGARAAVARLPLLTRDPRRYRSCFPSVELITPESTS
jgi:predicted nucleic acid-binding protein